MAGITLRDLADKLGVSAATISMVLNNKPGISEETRARVLQEVASSGYDIDRLFGPAKKQKGSIGFIVYKKHGQVVADTPFFSTLTESIERAAANAGYSLSIRYVSDTPELADIGKRGSDGLLLLGTEMEESDLDPFKNLGIPLVVLDNAFPLSKVNTVSIDNRGGIKDAVCLLKENGHRRIGYLKSSVTIRNFSERYESFCESALRLGIEQAPQISLRPNMEDACNDMRAWLESSKPAGAYVADNDIIALGAIRALREHGYMLGSDISIIGFDDLPFTRITEPPLTTVRVFNDIFGLTSFTRIAEVMQAPHLPFTHTVIGTELKIRGSVKSI